MSIRTMASGASARRGYEYYMENKVLSLSQTSDDEYTGMVAGSGSDPYQVTINTERPRRSKCNCPHADGRRVVCKHMVALYFAAFPDEAKQYMKDVKEAEREQEERLAEIRAYVKSLSKKELQEALFESLLNLDEIYQSRW